MLKSKKWAFVTGIMLVSFVVSACQGPTTIEVPVTVPAVVQTQLVIQTQVVEEIVRETQIVEVVATAEPPPPVDRTGAWLDTIVVVEEPSQDAAVSRLIAGDLDVYGTSIANAVIAERIRGSEALSSIRTFGLYDEVTFNPAGPEFADGRLNPFSVPAVREAVNWLIDRDYVAQELYGGMAVPRYLAIAPASSDYAILADVAKAAEARYAYDLERARAAIATEMEALGATLTGGKWQYNGAPVEIQAVIRTEDTRRQWGDYVANQMDEIGFTVVRNYRTAAEASPLWFQGDPTQGLFHWYTGGWSSTAVSRDEGGNFAFFYTTIGGLGPLWDAYVSDPAFFEVANRLDTNDFETVEERRELMTEALDLSLQDGTRVWVAHRAGLTPIRAEMQVAADLFGGVAGGGLWSHTLRRQGEVGGSARVGLPSILTEPWNPVAGSNWLFDRMLQRGVGELAVVTDPYTGLGLPNRIERADLQIVEGLPVGKTLDWIDLEFVAEIPVPDDAWADWDAVEQRFLTVGEVEPGRIASRMSRVHYPADMYETVAWHDGSAISAADFVMLMIMTFDRAKEDSAIYDAGAVAQFTSFMSAFKGVRIVSTDPLVIETYSDLYALDAENSVTTWWPEYGFGSAPWHTIALGVAADAAGEAVFSSSKATAAEVDRLNYIAGETVGILKTQLDAHLAAATIPYAATMSEYVTADEATARYTAITEWHRARGHMWVGTGPFYLERAFPVEGTVILQRNAAFPDSADRWSQFAQAAIPEVEVEGDNRVTIGGEATFEVFVDFAGAPYATADIQEVKYLVIDAEGNVAHVGNAEASADGLWEITLGSDVTGELAAGSNRLEAIVVSRRVALPVSASLLFVTAP